MVKCSYFIPLENTRKIKVLWCFHGVWNGNHCVKSVQIRSFFWAVFSSIWLEYGDLRSKFPYSVRIQKNTDQKKFRIWTLFTQKWVKAYSMGGVRCVLDFQATTWKPKDRHVNPKWLLLQRDGIHSYFNSNWAQLK